jgi:hypothetical protein
MTGPRLLLLLLAAGLCLGIAGCRRAAKTEAGKPQASSTPAAAPATPPATSEAAKPAAPEPPPATPGKSKQTNPVPPTGAANVMWEKSLDAATSKAKGANLPILAVCVYRDTGGSTVLRSDAFRDPTVGELCGDFVCVLVDLERDTESAQRLQVKAAPSIVIASADGTILASLQGYGSARRLEETMRQGLRAFAAGGGSSAQGE